MSNKKSKKSATASAPIPIDLPVAASPVSSIVSQASPIKESIDIAHPIAPAAPSPKPRGFTNKLRSLVSPNKNASIIIDPSAPPKPVHEMSKKELLAYAISLENEQLKNRKTIVSLTGQVRSLDNTVKQTTARAEHAEELVKEKEVVLKDMQLKIDQLQHDKLEAEEEAKEAKAALKKKDEELKGVQQEKDMIIRQAEMAKETIEHKMANIKIKLDFMEVEMVQKDATLLYLEAEAAEAKSEVKQLSQKLKDANKTIKTQQATIHNTLFENEQLKYKLDVTETENNRLEAENTNILTAEIRPSFKARLAAEVAQMDEKERQEMEKETRRRIDEEVHREIEKQYEEMKALVTNLGGGRVEVKNEKVDDGAEHRGDENGDGVVFEVVEEESWNEWDERGDAEVTLANADGSYSDEVASPVTRKYRKRV